MGMFDDLIPKATTPSAPPSTGGMFDDLIPKAPAKPSVLSSSAAAPEAAPAPAPAPRGLGVFDPNENTPQDVGEGVPSTELSITVEAPDGGYWNIPSLWWDDEGKPHKVNEEIAQRLAIEHEKNGGPAFSRFATPEEAAAAARARSDAGGGMARPTPFGVERPETLIDEATQQQPEQPETEDAPRLYGRGASLAGISERNKEASDARAAARTTPNRGGNVEKNVEASDYDPSVFENESLGALWMRRGQQVTRGAAGIAEAALRARSIADVKFETDELRKLGDEIIRASMVIAGDDPQFAKSLSGFEKAQWQSRLARAVAEVARINREGGVKPVEERWGAKAAAGISKYLDETIGAPDPRDQSFWGKLASGLGSMVGFMVPSMIPYVGLPLAAELGASASMDEAYQRAKMAGATEEQALTAASIGKWIGYTEVLPIASILNKVPDPIKARVIGAMGKFVSKHVARAAGKTLAEAIEEGVQEGGQAIYQNLVEKGVYNPETGVWKDVGENALIGFILGGLVSGAVQTVSDSPQTAAARAVADVMSGEPVRMPTPTTSRYISPADDASPIPNDLIESGKQIVEAALRGGPIPPTGGQPPAPLPAGLGTPAVPPEVSTTPPAEAQYEEMDEIETVNGEDRPTGRKVRVDLSTGQAQVLSDPAPAPAAPTIPAAEVIPPEDQGPDTPAELLDDAEKFEQIVKQSKPAGENVPDPETRILKNADFASISTDAKTFQYKGGADEEGVTDRLRDVRKWDITRANIGILYEYADGRLVVADGHQRHGLAKRAIADGQDVSWPVLVLREVDGYTPKRARAIAAQKNIAEGTGTAVDAAKVFRDLDMSPADLNLPMSSTLVRNGLDMKHLSKEAFGMVVNEVVAEQHAAIVGRLVKDPKKHADILSLVSRIGPQTQTQAEAIVRQADAEEVTETQTSLFGEETVSANLYEERAKVLDAALRTLGTEIQTFRTLDKRGNRIEEAGNKLRRGENKKILETDAELRAVLMADANRKGETSDALSQAARAVRGGTPVNTAAREFLETVRTGNGASKGNGAQAGNAGLGDGRPSPRAIGRKESDQRRGNEAGQAAGQGDASRSAADAGPERGSAGDGEGSLFAEGPGRPERGSGQPGADATGDARAEAERAADGPATDGPRDQAEAAPSGVIRRGRDEKYGVDVELRKDGEKYVIVQSDPNVPDKAIGASPMGVSVGDYMLNMEGEFVPARSIIQNESRSRTPDKAPFRGDENQRQRVLDLVVEMEFERAVGNSARVDQIESEIARIVAGLEPTQGAKEMRPGQYGSIEKPLRFVSGMSRPGDFTTLLREGQNVGVAINELSRASMPKIADELVKSGSGWLFVDSGAFSLFRANQIAEEQGNPPLFPDAKVDGKELNVERLFAQYNALAEAIGNKAAGDDRPQARVYYVLPDVVADQDATLAYLNSTYSQQIKDLADFSNAIMPLQGGDMSLAEFYEEAMRSFGHNPDTDLAPFIVGLPSRAAAVENAQVVDLLNKHGDRIDAIHILGAASDAAMKPRLDAMREAGWDGNVSSDGNRLRSFLNSSEDRAEAMRRLISEEVSRGKVGISKAARETEAMPQAQIDAAMAGGRALYENMIDLAPYVEGRDFQSAPRKAPEDVFPETDKEMVRHHDTKLRKVETISPEQAQARVAEWKAEAERMGREEDNSKKVIISLFDESGGWSKPWRDAGFTVLQYDIQLDGGQDMFERPPVDDIAELYEKGYEVYGVLSACPCNTFATSGARWWEPRHDVPNSELVEKMFGEAAAEYYDTPVEANKHLVAVTELVVEMANPTGFHALENPMGRIARAAGLPAPALRFDPHYYGDPYTKQTQIFGDFNADLPTAPVEPVEGSKMHKLWGGNPEQKRQRSQTPEGFAYAFFMANRPQAVAKEESVPGQVGISEAETEGPTTTQRNPRKMLAPTDTKSEGELPAGVVKRFNERAKSRAAENRAKLPPEMTAILAEADEVDVNLGDAIAAGMVNAASAGQTYDQNFARELIKKRANVMIAGKYPVEPRIWDSLDEIAEGDQEARALRTLDRPIMDAITKRLNEEQKKLAAMGFRRPADLQGGGTAEARAQAQKISFITGSAVRFAKQVRGWRSGWKNYPREKVDIARAQLEELVGPLPELQEGISVDPSTLAPTTGGSQEDMFAAPVKQRPKIADDVSAEEIEAELASMDVDLDELRSQQEAATEAPKAQMTGEETGSLSADEAAQAVREWLAAGRPPTGGFARVNGKSVNLSFGQWSGRNRLKTPGDKVFVNASDAPDAFYFPISAFPAPADGSLAVEATPEGQQSLIPGVAPITQRDRQQAEIEARRNAKLTGTDRGAKERDDLFGDPNARNDLFDTPAAPVAERAPQGIKITALQRGIDGTYRATDANGKLAGTLNVSPRAAYASSVMVEAGFQRKGVASALYAAAEADLGRKMMPSPLGLSADGIAFWKARLAKMPEAEAQALLSEMVKVGQDAGVGKSAEQRAGWLGYKQPLPDIWIEPAPENADITRRVFRRDGDGYEWASYSDYQANGDRARWFGYASKELPASIRGGENVKPADQPTNASDQPTNNLADGEPAETYTVYKGAGRADKNSVYNSVAVPILGEGSYYAFDKEDAEFYGPEVTSAVVRGRFYEVTNDVEWRALTKAVGWKYPNPYGLSKEEVARDTEALREYIIKQGYDGVKVEFDKNGPEVNVKLLMNVFSVPQIVQYTTAKASPKADPMAAFAEAKAAFAEADATKKIADPQKFFDLSAALGKARDAAADHLAARDEGGVVLRNASSTLGAMITKNTTGADPWRITYFDGRGFSGDRAFKDKSAAVRDAMREGYDTEDRDFLRKLRSGWDKAEPPASFDARPSEAKQGEVGMMLAEGEVVRTTTGRLTTPFPKIAGDSERKALNTEKRVETWLMVNAFEEATARGDEFNARVFEANIKKPSQSDKDSAEAYLFDPAFNQPVRQSILKPLSTPEAIKGTASVGQRMANARQSFIDAAVEQFGVTADQAARAADAYSRLKLVKFDPVDGQFHLKIGEAWERAAILGAAGEAATAPTTAEGTETARTPDTATSGALRAAMEAGEVEHVTKKGKTLTGYVVAGLDKAAAQQIDRFTFKKDGGFYVREAAAEKYLSGETEADTIAAENKERFTPVVTRDRVEVSGLENDGSNWLSYYEMDGRLYGAVYAYGKTSAWEQSRREGLSYGDPMNTVPAPRDFNGRRAQKISIAKVAKLHTERVEADQAFIDRHDELVGDFLRQQAPAAPGPDTDRFLAREQARGKIVTTPSNKKIAAKLRAVGESALAKGEEKFGQTRNTNTARRARMAAGAEAEAQTMIRRAKTAIAIADLIEAGEAGPLVGVTSMADVEALDNAIRGAQVQAARNLDSNSQAYRDKMGRDVPIEESDIDYMRPPAVQAWPKDIAGLLEGIGKARLADRARIKRIASHPENFSVTNTDDVAALADLVKVARAKGLGSNYAVKHLAEAVREFNRWKNMGATTQDERIALAKAYLNARRGQKAPTVDPMVAARRKLIGSKIPGFFETPEHIAARMVEEAGLMPGEKVLEPSAGAGRIAVAAAKIVGKENIDVIEINTTLQELLRTQGFDPVSSDFTGYAGGPEGGYDVILMNPPFEQRQDAEHVRRAFDLLRPGGRLVSIMGEGVFFGSDKKATEFREWIESLGAEGERLPAGTFEESGTGTNTRIIRINKPGSASQAQVGNSQVGNSEADTAPAITTPQEQAKPEPTTEMGTPTDLLGEVERTEAASSKIEDFGEKIEGARKDVWQDYADRLDGVADEDIATAPFAKVWPPADYQALIDGGADPWTVGFIRVARDLVPAKPRKNWKLKGWVKQVTILRQFAGDLLTGETSKERVIELLDRQEFRNLKRDLLGPIDLYMAVGHSKSIKGLTISAASYSMRNGITYNPAKVVWEVQQKQKATAFSNMPRVIAEGETRDAAIASFKEKFSSLDEPGKTARNVRFEIYSRPGQDGYFVGKKMGRNAVDLARFDTVAEARDYRNNHLDELVEKWKGITDIRERRGTNLARVGQDYRNGADVTPEQFSEAFGFRGVQFGNYVEGARRQQDLNEAYDGLLDLSGILGVDPRALSLNGELGLAFGARGTGGKNAAKAHYEPDQIVINLTKRAGAGSLAHEWFHGVDNYFERMRGRKIGYITDTPSTIEGRENNPRPEVLEAFQELKKAINKTGVQVRSRKLDQYRSNPYWATGIEMAARSFESYVIAKLQDQGYSNDYLANIVDEAMFEAEAALSGREPGGYPYPKASEVPIIREGFDNLFNVIQTKETERGVAMFSISRGAASNAGIDAAERMRSMFAIDLYHGSAADFDKFELRFMGTGEGVQAYGWGLYFAEAQHVAEGYKRKLSGRDNLRPDQEAIDKYQTEWDAVVAKKKANLLSDPTGHMSPEVLAKNLELSDALDDLSRKMIDDMLARKPWLKDGRLYNVRIHTGENEVLDWDADFNQQSPGVKDALRRMASDMLKKNGIEAVFEEVVVRSGQAIEELNAFAESTREAVRADPEFNPDGTKTGARVDHLNLQMAHANDAGYLAGKISEQIEELEGRMPSGDEARDLAFNLKEAGEYSRTARYLGKEMEMAQGAQRYEGALERIAEVSAAKGSEKARARTAKLLRDALDYIRPIRERANRQAEGVRGRDKGTENERDAWSRTVLDANLINLRMVRIEEALAAVDAKDADWVERAYFVKQNDVMNTDVISELAYLNDLYDNASVGSGGDIYRMFSTILGGDYSASKALEERGLKGLRFLDGFSRNDGEGTRNYVIWDEAVIEIMAKFQRAAAAEGITGWHGSAADFNRFDLGYLGTGEGAQMVGHGHYLAGVEATGKFYQETLTARGLIEARNVRRPEGISDADFRAVRDQLASFWGMWSGPAEIMQAIRKNASELTAAREYLAHLQKVRAEIKEGQPDLYKEFFEGRPDENLDRALAGLADAERAQRAVEVIEEFGGIDAFKHPGRLYRVRIMASEAEFLDWDRPLTEQPEHIVEAVADLAAEYGAGIGYSASGEVAYEAISRAMMSDPSGSMQQAHKLASEALFAKGIAGIKFKDAMSRGSADGGTNNYVVFDDSLLSILDKYQASGAQPGSVMYETRPEQREAVERMVVGIKRRLDQRGIGNIPVAAAEKMFGITPDGDKVRIDGAFVRGVVGVALNPDARGLDGHPGVEHTVDHETIHALRDPEIWGKSRPFGLFRAAEWMLLQKAALADTKRMAEVEKHYPLSQGWTRDNQIEEAIADMYADWQAGRMEVKGLIRSAFERIRDFIAAIRAVLRGEGFNTVDAIFRRVERGAVGRRQGPGSPMSQGAVKGWPETSELTGAYRTPMYAIAPRRRGRGAAGPLFQHNRTLTVPDRTIWDELTNHNRSLFANIRAAATGGASDTLDRFRWHLQDQFLPVMRAQEAIAAQGYVIDERENPYLKEEMMHGRVGRHLFEIDEEYTKPIVDLMAEHDLTVDQVDEYLYARHAEERNDRIASINPAMPDGGSGMDTADARQILAAVAAGPKARAYSQIGALIDRLRERTIRVRQDAGLLTAQEAAMWRRQYRHYVPLKGFVEDAADMRPSGIGKKFNVSGPESKRALGRRSEAFSPLQNALTQAQEVAIRAEKNRIGVALYNLVLNHPSPMWGIRTPEMKRFFNRTTGLVESRAVSPTLYRPSVDELALKVNGKEVRIKFNDPRLARAVGTLDAPTVGGIIRAGMSFSRYFSAVNTMMNPSFLVSNAFRDLQTAQINIQGFGKADAKAISKAMIKNWGRAFRAAYLGQVGVANDQWTRYYREYEQTGAKVAFWRLDMPAEARSDLEARLRIAKGGALTKVGQLLRPNTRDNPVLGFIERVNLSVDNAIRLAAYVEARRAGWSKEAAASLSKNLTVNFNRRGAMSPALNALYPFFNAALQGTHVMLWAMKSKPVRRVVAGIIAAGFLEDQINSWLSAEDDDDELAYDKVPDWRMRRYISLMFPDQENPVSFMMPYGYSVFSYAGKQLSKVTRGVKKPGDALVDFLAAAFEGFSPINGQTFLQVITPTFLEPIIEVTYNNNWLGNKIRPEYEFNDYGPKAYKYFSGVSDASRVASDIMNQVTGGSRVESGLLDISPEYIDHMAGWATGGMGRFAGRVSDLGVKMAFGEFDEIEVGKIPFARQLYFETGDWLDSDRYYRFRDEVREAKEAVKEAREMGSLPSSETLKKARLDGKLNDVEKKVSALRKKIRVIQANESLTEAQRRDKLKPLRERQNHYMLRFNKAYVGAMGPQGE